MAEDSYKLLEWGLEEESCLQIKSQSLGTVVQFREKEFLVLGQKEITRFESTIVKESYPYVLTALVPVPKYDILIGVTAVSAEFIILFQSDLKNHLMTGVKVNDQSVFNIIFSSKSDTIITSGEHLITWSFKYTPSETSVVFTYPTIKISMKKNILSHIHSSIMNPPMFDYLHEELYINDNKGNIQSYDLNGITNGTAIKYGSLTQTACGFNSDTQHFMTTNSNQGAILWPKRAGGINKRFFIGTSASLAIQFLDDECVAILDAKYMITIIDVKTSNFFNCYQSKFPIHRMFYFQKPIPRIVLCSGGTVILLKVNLPWRFWNPTFGKPLSIKRSNKRGEAARITVVLENSHVRLISPKTGSILTAATLTSLATPITCFYDRGTNEIKLDNNVKRDQLLIPLIDGPMEIFSTGQDPCEMIGRIDIKITSVCECKFRNEWSFCFSTNVGQLLFYSYNNMKMIGRIVCNHKYPIIGTFYDRESECLILAFNDRSVLLSLQQEKEVGDYIHVKCSKVSLFFDRILIFASEKGLIESLYVLNKQLLRHETNSMRLHDDSITSFSLGSTFFVSSSIDKTVKVWSKEFHVLCKLVLPLPILQCCVMNGKRDILVATLNEIMIVKGSDVFGDLIDQEDELYDNYDKKSDFLDSSFMMFADEEEEKEESVFTGRKKNNDPKKSKVNARRKRIIEALKKQMLMMENKNNQIENQNIEIDSKPKNMINLPKDENKMLIQKNIHKKNDKKSEDESSYEYVLEEEEEDRKSNSSQPIDKKPKTENKNEEKMEKTKNDDEKEKDEIEKKKRLLEKQKADLEKEKKEKEILKMYNDSKRAKEIKEPIYNSKPRPARQRPFRPKQEQDSSENFGKDNKNDDLQEEKKHNENENEKQKDSKTKKNLKLKTNKNEINQNDESKLKLKSNESKNNENPEKDKIKSKNKKVKTKDNTNENESQDGSESSKQKQKEKDKKKIKNKNSNKDNENVNNSNKDNEKSHSNNITKNVKAKSNAKAKDNNNKDTKSKNDSKAQNISDQSNNNDKMKDKTEENSSQNKENENQKKSKTQKTNQKSQLQSIKKGYKNASSQTIEPSSLKKVANIPQTVPSNIAIIPQIAKARRVRRSPTPPTSRPQRERRPLFDPIPRKRSRTPEPLRFLVDGSAPPVNLFFDINMVRKMAENGDSRYAHLLKLLERQGLKSDKLPSLPFQTQKNISPPKNFRRGNFMNNYSSPSWEVMVTLPPINISQIKKQKQLNKIESESTEKKLDTESNLQNLTNNNNDFNENVDDKMEKETKNSTNYGRNSSFKFNNNDFSSDLYNNPSLLYDNQIFSMKKVPKPLSKSRGSSVPNVNKTVAEMKLCKEKLMQKILEKRAKETNQTDDDETSIPLQENEIKDSNLLVDEINREKSDQNDLNSIDSNYINNEDKNENHYNNDLIEHQNSSIPQKLNAARFGSLNLNPRFSNQMKSNSSKEPTFVEPIMPIYLRTSKDVRYIKQNGISPFACKRYRMVVDSNGPRDAKNFPSHRTASKSVNNSQSKKTLIDQYVRSPKQLLKPIHLMKTPTKH